MRIVITYRETGRNSEYSHLISMALASAKKLGYETVIVGDCGADAADHVLKVDYTHPALMNWILAAQLAYLQSSLFECNSVFFSPDAIVVKPLEDIFEKKFDAAFTTRPHRKGMFVNNGVIFVKPENRSALISFWKAALKGCEAYPKDLQEWYGDQRILADMLAEGKDHQHGIDTQRLPCHIYNRPAPRDWNPVTSSQVRDGAYIVHFKGRTKPFMQQFWDSIR